jgi:hypothetical protein
MFTRDDYFDRKCSHREYYSQFVTPAITSRVKACIGLERLKASTDPHLNNIPLREWDNLVTPCPAEVGKLMREAGDYPTQAGLVCTAKEAARQLLD